MQYKTFIINTGDCQIAEEQLNAFLRSHRIITIQKEFVESKCSWYFLVEYTEDFAETKTTRKIDYMKILSQEDFAVFSKLRELRKKIAVEEKIPAYAIFTDEQLSHIATERPDSLQKLQKINGIGTSKAEKYGEAFLKIVGSSPKMTENVSFPCLTRESKTQDDFDIF